VRDASIGIGLGFRAVECIAGGGGSEAAAF